jgi:hypothetical protein
MRRGAGDHLSLLYYARPILPGQYHQDIIIRRTQKASLNSPGPQLSRKSWARRSLVGSLTTSPSHVMGYASWSFFPPSLTTYDFALGLTVTRHPLV